ncbi:MAG: hypothetical protein LC775_19835, partial [Acidobacteria bacterium]|nr:hypothetical protein [Acidobacteriota bacterium]
LLLFTHLAPPKNYLYLASHRLESKRLTLAFSCGARSAFDRRRKRLLEKHATAPSAARLCYARLKTIGFT